MSDAWKKLDLDGQGLQTVNLIMAKQQRHHKTAYLLWLLFPIGAHRVYLKSSALGLVYTALTALGIIFSISDSAGLPFFALEVAFALFDLWWIDKRVLDLNKSLRMHLLMQKGMQTPEDYRGRYVDETHLVDEYSNLKASEKVSDKRAFSQPTELPGKHIPSFAEQEKLLNELVKHKKPNS